jgi:hypothetical protein
MIENGRVIAENDWVMIENDHWSGDDAGHDVDEDDDGQIPIENNHFILKMIVLWLKTILL